VAAAIRSWTWALDPQTTRISPLARGVGFVPFKNLIGRADRVIFSSGGRSLVYVWTWRLDRFFKRII